MCTRYLRLIVFVSSSLSLLSGTALAQVSSTEWTPIGRGIISPNIGESAGKPHQCGRLIQAAWSLDNRQGQNILWMGAAVGGLWKSNVDSSGNVQNWVTLTDNFPGPHVMGSFLVHRLDSNKILIGPGSIWSPKGDGKIYLTKTQGNTWVGIDLPTFKDIQKLTRINRIVEDLSDTTGNTVLACTNNGIFRSVDFGTVWERVFRGEKDTHVDEVTDIVQDTGNHQTWYAAKLFNGMILRSTTGGINGSWSLFTGTDKILGAAGRVSLATCASHPKVLYALVINTDTFNSDGSVKTVEGELKGVYRSTDRAKNWKKITLEDVNEAINHANQGMHTSGIACDPTDPGHIVFGLQTALETYNATYSKPKNMKWRDVDTRHHDYNFILFRPGFTNIVIANDGGYYTYDPVTQAVDDSGNLLGINATFLEISIGGMAGSHSNPELFIAGLVDNGVVRGNAVTGTLELMIGETDGGQVSIMPDLSNVMAATINGGPRKQSFDFGLTWLDISNGLNDDSFSSILIDPTPGQPLPNIFNYSVFPGLSFVFFRPCLIPGFPWFPVSGIPVPGEITYLDHTTDPLLDTLVMTLKDQQTLWSLSGPRASLGSLTPSNITPLLPALIGPADAHANADKSILQPNTIYYTTNIARPSRAFLSLTNGSPGSWVDVTGNLPQAGPDFVKLIGNPRNMFDLFLATSNGVFRTDGFSFLTGWHWIPYSEGLRINEEVDDIVINSDGPRLQTLYVATRGRGFYQRAIQ